MDYVVCIPSYKRAKICQERTLKTLARHGIEAGKIIVYVANQAEHDEYVAKLEPNIYSKIIIGEIGLVQQRQFIEAQHPDGTYIVFMDDDIDEIDLSLSPSFATGTLNHFICEAFKNCVNADAYIWGVNPVYNPFFRAASEQRKQSPELTTDLKYIVGAFYGMINRPNLSKIKLSITNENGQKEDVERSIRYFINDGKLVRFNLIAFKTKYYGTDGGGLGKFKDRLEPMRLASERLLKEFPAYGSIKTRKTGMTEFVLKNHKAFVPDFEVAVGATLDAEFFEPLYALLNQMKIKPRSGRNNRLGFAEGSRFGTFGETRARFTGVVGLSFYSKKYGNIYNELVRIGKIICPFEFKSIHINHNVSCPPHKDANNQGRSTLVSFGDYTGGKIVIEDKEHDARHTPITFNGSQLTHFNTPDLVGNKYSLVFFL